jgi:plastocyanin
VLGRELLLAAGPAGIYRADAGAAEATTVNVNVGNTFFSPANVTIAPGDSVKWNWVGGIHSATSGSCAGNCAPDGVWDSGIKGSGTFTFTFPGPGTFPYYCRVHLESMVGQVKVNGPQPLVATASASVTTGEAPLAVAFTGAASGGTPPYTYAWDFGDRTVSSEQNPSHTFTAAGSYSVVLTVTDAASATAADSHLSIVAGAVQPPGVTSVRKLGAPFRIVILGSNFQTGLVVSINGEPWTQSTLKGSGKIVLKGGASLKAVVPKGTQVEITVRNPDGGSATVLFQWP